eukprot:8490138-Ditylum_brightwellii.AAC.2
MGEEWNNQLDGDEALLCPSLYLAKASSTLHFIAAGYKPKLWRWREVTSKNPAVSITGRMPGVMK